jgi:hypothetical protein
MQIADLNPPVYRIDHAIQLLHASAWTTRGFIFQDLQSLVAAHAIALAHILSIGMRVTPGNAEHFREILKENGQLILVRPPPSWTAIAMLSSLADTNPSRDRGEEDSYALVTSDHRLVE